MTHQFWRFNDGYFCPKVGNGEGNCLSIKPVRRVPHQANPVGQERDNFLLEVLRSSMANGQSILVSFPVFTRPHSQSSPVSFPIFTQSSPVSFPVFTQSHSCLHPVSFPVFTQSHSQSSPVSFPVFTSLIPNLHPISFPVFTQPKLPKPHLKFCVCEYRTVVLTVIHLA